MTAVCGMNRRRWQVNATAVVDLLATDRAKTLVARAVAAAKDQVKAATNPELPAQGKTAKAQAARVTVNKATVRKAVAKAKVKVKAMLATVIAEAVAVSAVEVLVVEAVRVQCPLIYRMVVTTMW